jgi:hypothetical protein
MILTAAAGAEELRYTHAGESSGRRAVDGRSRAVVGVQGAADRYEDAGLPDENSGRRWVDSVVRWRVVDGCVELQL